MDMLYISTEESFVRVSELTHDYDVSTWSQYYPSWVYTKIHYKRNVQYTKYLYFYKGHGKSQWTLSLQANIHLPCWQFQKKILYWKFW